MAIGGLDIGTSGAKVTVMDPEGRILHAGSRSYAVSRSSSAHEVHADAIWEAVRDLLREAALATPDLAAVGVTSFGESFVLLDGEDRVLLPTMLYTDPHGGDEAEALNRSMGPDAVRAVAGCAPHAMYSLPKLMWIRAHHPEAYARTRRICLIADFVAYRLTGRHLIDRSLAARTMAFDIRKLAWSREILAAADIDPALFPEPVPTGTDAGCVRPGVAAELGLRKDLHVVLCCHDQVAAAVGSGVLTPGQATDGAGSVQCVTPVFSGIPEGRSLQDGGYAIVPFLGEGTYCTYAFSYTGGALLKWFVDTCCAADRAAAKAAGGSVYRHFEADLKDEPTGILVLPHFAGAATPYMDGGSKGAIVGLSLSHSLSDLYRAVLEGVVYEMAVNQERLGAAGIRVEGLHATGGGAQSRVWLQMKADVLGVPVTRMRVDEAGTVGGILLTGVATGAFADLRQGAARLVEADEVFHPRPALHARYQEVFARYRRLYEAVRPLA